MNASEKELLDIMLLAPASDIDGCVQDSADWCRQFLGLAANVKYVPDTHYFQVLAKLRRRWAQVMIAEATGS